MLQPSRAQTQNSLAETLQQLQILLKSNQAQAQDPQAEELKQLIYQSLLELQQDKELLQQIQQQPFAILPQILGIAEQLQQGLKQAQQGQPQAAIAAYQKALALLGRINFVHLKPLRFSLLGITTTTSDSPRQR